MTLDAVAQEEISPGDDEQCLTCSRLQHIAVEYSRVQKSMLSSHRVDVTGIYFLPQICPVDDMPHALKVKAFLVNNPLKPNDTYRRRTAPLTSKVAFYKFIQQIQVPNILNVVYTLRFFLFKMQFVS